MGVFCFAAVVCDVRVGGGDGGDRFHGWCECESRFAIFSESSFDILTKWQRSTEMLRRVRSGS